MGFFILSGRNSKMGNISPITCWISNHGPKCMPVRDLIQSNPLHPHNNPRWQWQSLPLSLYTGGNWSKKEIHSLPKPPSLVKANLGSGRQIPVSTLFTTKSLCSACALKVRSSNRERSWAELMSWAVQPHPVSVPGTKGKAQQPGAGWS